MKRNDSSADDSGRVSNDTINGILITCFLVVILGMGICIFIFLFPKYRSAKLSQVEADSKVFGRALTLYKFNAGSFPTTDQGLKALVEMPSYPPVPRRWSQMMKSLPTDPWGADYDYCFPGSKDPAKPEIISPGADGVAYTADDLSSQDE